MNAARTPLLAANWKSNHRWEDCERFVDRLHELEPDYFRADYEPPVDILICPPFTYIALLGSLLEEAAIYLGAQDVSRFSGRAYTGDIAAGMLADLECDYAIVGHSERRRVLGDSDEIVKEKLARLREAELLPVLCVGEELAEREQGRALDFTLGQLAEVADELKQIEAGMLAVAYEPVWAIGTGRSAEPADAQEMAAAIRGWLRDHLGPGQAERTPVLYGGSVKPENIGGYAEQADIDGALVGGASLEADSFAALLAALSALRQE